jgi:hypothetical protein
METQNPAERLAEQTKQVKDGCYFVVGWAVIIAIGAVAYFGLETFLLWSVPAASDQVIVFIPFAVVANEMFYGLLFGAAIAVFGLAMLGEKFPARLAAGLVILVVMAGVWTEWWGHFAALRFEKDAVVLHYIWPRASQRIERAEILSTDSIWSSRGGGPMSIDTYSLQLKTAKGDYLSFGTGDETVQIARRRLSPSSPGSGPR